MVWRVREEGLPTDKNFDEAQPFSVFLGYQDHPAGMPGAHSSWWDLFEIQDLAAQPGRDVRDVLDMLENVGVYVSFENPQRDDVEAPENFTDLDAARAALSYGEVLMKVPDALYGTRSEYWRLYAVDVDRLCRD